MKMMMMKIAVNSEHLGQMFKAQMLKALTCNNFYYYISIYSYTNCFLFFSTDG